MYEFFRDLILVGFYPNFTVFIEEITVDGVAKTVPEFYEFLVLN